MTDNKIMTPHLWETQGLCKDFSMATSWFGAKQKVKALQDVSLYQDVGETLGIVGESGCGKSTFGRVLMGLQSPTSGLVRLDGQVVDPKKDRQRMIDSIQMIFQDPLASLNPRMRVFDILEEPLLVKGHLTKGDRRDKVLAMLEQVGLSAAYGDRYAHEFSGGQRQRVGIARALIMEPRCIVCDEPISALDVSIQVQIVELLERLQEEEKMSFLFISHDLNMVRYLSDRMAVMYLGMVLEEGPASLLYERPLHPYTQALMDLNKPIAPGTTLSTHLQGEVPSPLAPPTGCLFHTRCPRAQADCAIHRPALVEKDGRRVACHSA